MHLVKGVCFFLDTPLSTLTKLTAGRILTMFQTSGRLLNKKISVASACALFSLLPFLTSCMTSPVSISPSSHYISAKDVVTDIGPAAGSAWSGQILFFPFGAGHMIEPAVNRALKATGADALVDVRVESHTYFFLIIIIHRTEVYGRAVKIIRGGAQ